MYQSDNNGLLLFVIIKRFIRDEVEIYYGRREDGDCKCIKIAGRQAYDVARAQGLPVTVLRGNNVCRIESEGKVSIVSKGRQAKYKVVKRKYSL